MFVFESEIHVHIPGFLFTSILGNKIAYWARTHTVQRHIPITYVHILSIDRQILVQISLIRLSTHTTWFKLPAGQGPTLCKGIYLVCRRRQYAVQCSTIDLIEQALLTALLSQPTCTCIAQSMPLENVCPCPGGILNHVIWVDASLMRFVPISVRICLVLCRYMYMPLHSVGPRPIGGYIS